MAVWKEHLSFWTQLDAEETEELKKIWQQESSWKQIISERFNWVKIAFIFAGACTR